MSITLPPLPPVDYDAGWQRQYTADQLRARDREIARIVLEAAAQAAQPDDSYQDEWFYAKADAVKCIRALEVRHE